MTDYSCLRAIVLRQSWPGCTGLCAENALTRHCVAVQNVVENDFLPSWESFGMKVVSKLLRRAEIGEYNAALLRLAEAFRPHFLLSVKGQFVAPESVRRLKAMGIRCICYYPDVSMLAHGPYIPQTMPLYDWVFTSKSFGPRDLADLFSIAACSYLPHAADPDFHRPRRAGSAREAAGYECDVSFIGGWSEGKEAVLTEIARALPGISMKIWGSRWRNVASSSILAPSLQHREIFGPGYALGVGGSRINLALVHEKVRGASSGDLITSRTFHIPACGGFMLHRRTADLPAVFTEGAECAAFDDAGEAVRQIRRYLSDEESRARIAENGRRRVLKNHLWDHRVSAILDRYFLLQAGTGDTHGER